MWTLIIINLISGGFTTTTLHDFSSEAACQSALTSVVLINKQLGTKPGVFQATCTPK